MGGIVKKKKAEKKRKRDQNGDQCLNEVESARNTTHSIPQYQTGVDSTGNKQSFPEKEGLCLPQGKYDTFVCKFNIWNAKSAPTTVLIFD